MPKLFNKVFAGNAAIVEKSSLENNYYLFSQERI